jgi:hypothetical protein
MNTPIQLKINLTSQMQELLASKAGKFGVPLTQYVKHVLMKEVQDVEYPVFKASEETEKEARKALEQLDKTVDAKSFFKQLHDDR